jgi:hypothetical protein
MFSNILEEPAAFIFMAGEQLHAERWSVMPGKASMGWG